ncbi:hypothetical protein JYT22_00135 [Endomicrobium sp. AH-315-J14]|nr:hypothetical protein [Endomicrobium sp. AH-315-J14]
MSGTGTGLEPKAETMGCYDDMGGGAMGAMMGQGGRGVPNVVRAGHFGSNVICQAQSFTSTDGGAGAGDKTRITLVKYFDISLWVNAYAEAIAHSITFTGTPAAGTWQIELLRTFRSNEVPGTVVTGSAQTLPLTGPLTAGYASASFTPDSSMVQVDLVYTDSTASGTSTITLSLNLLGRPC